ncbi:MAG: hypothetical protein J5643_01695 [Lachnospiraceae bacterium]|nr:hypothetical protein [Lachnospiraceae bacterium]
MLIKRFTEVTPRCGERIRSGTERAYSRTAETHCGIGRSNGLNASYTVEATFIIPIVTVIIVLLISETLFYRDILTAERAAMNAAENGLRYAAADAAFGKADWDYSHMSSAGVSGMLLHRIRAKDRQKIEEYATEKLKENLWFAVPGPVTAESDGDNITVSVTITARDGILAVFRPLNKGLFARTVSVTASGHDAPGANRILVAAWETGDRTKGVSEVLDKIQTIIEKVLG